MSAPYLSPTPIAVIVGSLRQAAFNRLAAEALMDGFGASHHLRQTLVNLDVACMPQPEACLSWGQKLFDEHGQPTERCRDTRQRFLDGYAPWIKRVSP